MYQKMSDAYDAMSAAIMAQNGHEDADTIRTLEAMDKARTGVYVWLLENRHLRNEG